jgi:putative ABC transport system permease protein
VIQIFVLAWRNIWRSRRRSLITIGSIFFAVFFADIMRSFQLGSYNHFIFQSIESYSGYLQIQNPDYFADPQLDNAFATDSMLISVVNNEKDIKAYTTRINCFGIVSSVEKTKGALINVIDPEKEKNFSDYEQRIVRFRFDKNIIDSFLLLDEIPKKKKELIKLYYGYSFSSEQRIVQDLKLEPEDINTWLTKLLDRTRVNGQTLAKNDTGVMVSDRLSRFLNLNVGDTLIIIASGYHGVSATGLFPVRAIIKMPSIELDNKLIYMSIYKGKDFLNMPDMATEMAINLYDNKKMDEIQKVISSKLPTSRFIVKNWREVNPTLKQQIEGDNISGLIFLGILYLIVFFGIFGTLLMMIMERKRQLAILLSIGMARFKLSLMIITELFIIGITGVLFGSIASTPIIIYGHDFPIRLTGDMAQMLEEMGFDPIMPMAWFDSYFFNQAYTIMIMGLIASIVPLINIYRMKIFKTLKS